MRSATRRGRAPCQRDHPFPPGAVTSRAWFERAFEFGMSPVALPDIVERLRGTPLRLRERVLGTAPEVLTVRPGASWSVLEHAGQLGDLERDRGSRDESDPRGR